MQVLASQLHFQANRNAELAIPPLFWPVNCIKRGGQVVLLSDPTVYSLYCDNILNQLYTPVIFAPFSPNIVDSNLQRFSYKKWNICVLQAVKYSVCSVR